MAIRFICNSKTTPSHVTKLSTNRLPHSQSHNSQSGRKTNIYSFPPVTMSSISIPIPDDESDSLDPRPPSMPPTSGLLKPRQIRSRQHILQDYHEKQNQRHQSFGPRSKKKNEILTRAFVIIIKNRWGLIVFFPLFGLILFGLWRVFSLTHHNMGRVDPNLRVSVKRQKSRFFLSFS